VLLIWAYAHTLVSLSELELLAVDTLSGISVINKYDLLLRIAPGLNNQNYVSPSFEKVASRVTASDSPRGKVDDSVEIAPFTRPAIPSTSCTVRLPSVVLTLRAARLATMTCWLT
jgi:hypothetical protein